MRNAPQVDASDSLIHSLLGIRGVVLVHSRVVRVMQSSRTGVISGQNSPFIGGIVCSSAYFFSSCHWVNDMKTMDGGETRLESQVSKMVSSWNRDRKLQFPLANKIHTVIIRHFGMVLLRPEGKIDRESTSKVVRSQIWQQTPNQDSPTNFVFEPPPGPRLIIPSLTHVASDRSHSDQERRWPHVLPRQEVRPC
jgi:hypothetical protein